MLVLESDPSRTTHAVPGRHFSVLTGMTCSYRYDAIALGAEEAKHPSAVPVGMGASLVAVTIIYVLMVLCRLRLMHAGAALCLACSRNMHINLGVSACWPAMTVHRVALRSCSDSVFHFSQPLWTPFTGVRPGHAGAVRDSGGPVGEHECVGIRVRLPVRRHGVGVLRRVGLRQHRHHHQRRHQCVTTMAQQIMVVSNSVSSASLTALI